MKTCITELLTASKNVP